MPFQNYSDGLYLAKQAVNDKIGIDHYAVIDVGNVLGLNLGTVNQPVVIHQTPPAIRTDWLQDTGTWQVLGRVAEHNIPEAINRIDEAFNNPNYDLFSNNCEQFARYVVQGERYSIQLRWVGGLIAVGAIAYLVARNNRSGNRDT